MNTRPAYDEFLLEHGGNTVRLRPSLRAVSSLEAKHGFEALFRRIDEFHLTTITDIIMTAATDRKEAKAFLASIAQVPMNAVIAATYKPVCDLVRAFLPASEEKATPTPGKPMTWPEAFRELYRTATGWLGWTPEAAWNATPTEINEAFAGHIAMLKAVNGSTDTTDKQPHHNQAERNLAEGLDPEFDREGLRALKARLSR